MPLEGCPADDTRAARLRGEPGPLTPLVASQGAIAPDTARTFVPLDASTEPRRP